MVHVTVAPATPHRKPRPRHAKGRWMQVRSTEILQKYMEASGLNQSELARLSGTARQYVHLLATGQRKSCGPRIARRIEEALRVLPGTIFVEMKSSTTRRRVNKAKTAVSA